MMSKGEILGKIICVFLCITLMRCSIINAQTPSNCQLRINEIKKVQDKINTANLDIIANYETAINLHLEKQKINNIKHIYTYGGIGIGVGFITALLLIK